MRGTQGFNRGKRVLCLLSNLKVPMEDVWFPSSMFTLPETNKAHEKSTILMVFTRKDGIFMGYVSFREGKGQSFFQGMLRWVSLANRKI